MKRNDIKQLILRNVSSKNYVNSYLKINFKSVKYIFLRFSNRKIIDKEFYKFSAGRDKIFLSLAQPTRFYLITRFI